MLWDGYLQIQDLVGRLTMDEMVAQMSHGGADKNGTYSQVTLGHIDAYSCPPNLQVPLHSFDRLGIKPYQWGTECLSGDVRAGAATSFPQAIGMVMASSPASKSCMGEDNFLGFVIYIVWKKYMDYFFVSVYETPSHNYYNYTPAVEPGSDMQQRYLTPPPPNIAYAHKGVPPINTLGMHCRGVGAGGAGGLQPPQYSDWGGRAPPIFDIQYYPLTQWNLKIKDNSGPAISLGH